MNEGVAPHEICWGEGREGLFDEPLEMAGEDFPTLDLPPVVRSRLEEACGFLDEERWSLPYRVLWRWSRGEREALLPGDIDGTRLARRARAVCGDAHAMKGFLRFRERPEGDPRFVAWYEPRHAVLPEVARHFAARMGRTAWLIATPQGTAAWDGQHLAFGQLVSELPEDSDLTEELWLRYYRSTFNPERFNERALEAFLPQRFRKGLIEAPLIPTLVSEARLGDSRQILEISPLKREPLGNCQTGHVERAGAIQGLEACRRCGLWEHATYPVGGSGPSDARLIIVGEQPDDHDDLIGEPFSGPLGRFLEALLNEAGLSRESVFLTHAVKHFRFEMKALQRSYRSPAPEQVEACRGWLEQELARLPARVVVALGRTAVRALGLSDGENPCQGGLSPIMQGDYEIFTTWHPAYALRAREESARAIARTHIVTSLRSAGLRARGGVGRLDGQGC